MTRWVSIIRVVVGGYAASLFLWAIAHPTALPGFFLKNELPPDMRRGLLLALIGGSVGALAAWLLIGWVLIRAGQRPAGPWLRVCKSVTSRFGRSPTEPTAELVFLRTLSRLAQGISLATPLPFLLILATPELAQRLAVFVLGLAVAMVIIVVARRWVSAGAPRAMLISADTVAVASSPVGIGFVSALLLVAGYVTCMSIVSIAQHNSFMTHAFDLGIQDQVVYNILHTGRMVTTLLGPTLRIYDHFSPIFYLIAPLYLFFQDSRILLVLQSLFLGIGALPLYALTRDKTRRTALAVTLAASYLLYPALHGVNLGDFHQIAFASGLLLCALYFLERGRDRLFLATLFLALLTKEEVALSVAAIGVYVLVAKRRPRLGLALTLIGILYFGVVINWLLPLGSAEYRYAGFLIPGKGLLSSLVITLGTNPVYAILYIFSDPAKLIYLAQLFLPVLFLPLLAPVEAWIVALPALLLQLLIAPGADYGIGFHYSAHVTPLIFFLTALALSRLKAAAGAAPSTPGRTVLPPKSGGWGGLLRAVLGARAPLIVGLLAASLVMSYLFGQIIPRHGLRLPQPTPHERIVQSFFGDIPATASVSTLSDLIPHLSARRAIYLFPIVADADYLLFDADMTANYWPREGIKARSQAIASLLPYIEAGQYGLIRQQDGVLLLKREHSAAGNWAALHTLLSAKYEARTLTGDLGTLVSDPRASRGEARIATAAALRADGKTALVFGPYMDLPAGKYRVEFSLKTDQIGRADRVATVDVFTHVDGYPRAARDILGADFTAADQYQSFALEFESDRPLQDLEFRVQYAGLGMLGLDTIQVTPIEVWLR